MTRQRGRDGRGRATAVDRYMVAEFLTREQRERAAMAEYVRDDFGAVRTPGADVCPLGVAFCLGYSPDVEEVAEIMSKAGDHDLYDALEAADSFIQDVDLGLLGPSDVAAALGMTGAAPAAEPGR